MNPQDKEKYARVLLDFLPENISGNLLDIGCGKEQVLVKEAKKRGFKAMGIDPLLNTDLEHFKTSKKFDVIVLKHVIEHISDLDDFLKKIHFLLNKNGLLLISCPNIKSLMYFIFRKRWYGLQPAQHVWQFTPELLKTTLERNNFQIITATINSMDYQVPGVKGIIFNTLLAIAKILPVGDQLVFIAKRGKYIHR